MKFKPLLLGALTLSSGAAFANLETVTPKAPSYDIQREYIEIVFKQACDIGNKKITTEQSRDNMKRYVGKLADNGITLAELKDLGQMDKLPSVREEMMRRYKAGECG